MKHQTKIVGKDKNGNDLTIIVRFPDRNLLTQAQKVYANSLKLALDNGFLFKAAMEKHLKAQSIWTDEDETEINNLRIEAAKLLDKIKTGKDENGSVLKLSDAKTIAFSVRAIRNKISNISSKRDMYDDSCADSVAESSRFDFLASKCFLKEDGNPLFNSPEDYDDGSNQDVVQKAAHELMCRLYGIDSDYMKKLPENMFLLKYGFVNDDLVAKEVEEQLKKLENTTEEPEVEAKFLDESGNLI